MSVLRYAAVPSMAVLTVLAAAAFPLPRRRLARAALAVTALWLVGVAVVTFRPAQTERSDGPSWRPQVEQAGTSCPADGEAVLEVAPGGGWVATVPCELLPAG